MKILITTGIYPPKTSGPAQYAYNMNKLWTDMGHTVFVKKFDFEYYLPTGIRHLYFFIKIIPSVIKSDVIFSLDTFSVGFPSVLASKMFGKKIVIRTGGDFLWEGYVERTGDLVLLRDFYKISLFKLSLKEKVIFKLIRWTINNCNSLVFTTKWQRDIFEIPYNLNLNNIKIIENHYDKNNAIETNKVNNKIFVGSVRNLKWKNINLLKEVFNDLEIKNNGLDLFLDNLNHDDFVKKIRASYAVILVSLGDISPHLINDALGQNKPFILTKECGVLDRVGDFALLVDPKNKDDIKEKILWLSNENNYNIQVEKVKSFNFVREWKDVANDYIDLFNKKL